MKNLFFDWEVNDHTGWGIYGLNLLIHGVANKKIRPVSLIWPPKINYPLDPITAIELNQLIKDWEKIAHNKSEDIFLNALGNSSKKLYEKEVFLKTDVAVIFFENWPLEKNYIEKLKCYEKIIVSSKWNFEKLKEINLNSIINIQGVDTENLRLMSKKKYKNKFVVFSGGKLEYRKGQDIILSAFAKFSKKYKDSILITAWASPWAQNVSQSINLSKICEPFTWEENFNKSLKIWAQKNNINSEQFVVLDQFPSRLLPDILREVDLALFTNRCEGGTNLVAMEALASGVVCGISRNTGHKDIINKDNCIPFDNQQMVKIPNMDTEDWGETSVDECIHVMELAYSNNKVLDKEKIKNSMNSYTWENSINNLFKKVLD